MLYLKLSKEIDDLIYICGQDSSVQNASGNTANSGLDNYNPFAQKPTTTSTPAAPAAQPAAQPAAVAPVTVALLYY